MFSSETRYENGGYQWQPSNRRKEREDNEKKRKKEERLNKPPSCVREAKRHLPVERQFSQCSFCPGVTTVGQNPRPFVKILILI